MTPSEFKAARIALCYTQDELAAEWGMCADGARTIRKWENGERPMNSIAAYALTMMQKQLHG